METLVTDARTPVRLAETADGEVVIAYSRRESTLDNAVTSVYRTTPGADGNTSPLRSGIRIIGATSSVAGVVLSGDESGMTPWRYFYVPPGGGPIVERPTHPQLPSSLGGFSIGREGTIGFIGLAGLSGPANSVFRDRPETLPVAEELDATAVAHPNGLGKTLVDSAGRVIVSPQENYPISRHEADGNWTQLIADGGRLLDIAADDRFVYNQRSDNNLWIFRSDRTEPLHEFQSPVLYYCGIADNGAVAAGVANIIGVPYSAVYVAPSGAVTDLHTLVGGDNVPQQLSMNDLGEVAFMTNSLTTGRKLWFYDGSNLQLLASGLPSLYRDTSVNQQPLLLTGAGEVYFAALEAGGLPDVRLYRVAVPEPSGTAVCALALLLIGTRRRQRRRRLERLGVV